ncbi:MAG: hypothetical protein WA063_07485 [Minisyncoccia bacterium]
MPSGNIDKKKLIGRKILPTITTTHGSDWRKKIGEINKLGLEEVALFPTCLDLGGRSELYGLLEKSGLKKIPYVHLRNDMTPKEIGGLIERFGAEIFNLHTEREFPFANDYSKYAKNIFIENIYFPLSEVEIEKFGGICVDFSHLENDRLLYPEKFRHNVRLIEKFKIGCNHIATIKKEARIDPGNKYDRSNRRYDAHDYCDLSEFDYLKNYPLNYFSNYIAIELENTIEEQLLAKEYLEKLINKLK